MAPFNEEDRKWLYDTMKAKGVDTGSYDDFKKSLANKEDREWYYNKGKSFGLDLGTQGDFDKMMWEQVQAAPTQPRQTTPVQQQPKTQPTQTPQAQQKPTPLQMPQGFGELDIQQANRMGAGRGHVSWNEPGVINPQTGKSEPIQEKNIAKDINKAVKGDKNASKRSGLDTAVRRMQEEREYAEATGNPLRNIVNIPFTAPTAVRDKDGQMLMGQTTDEQRVAQYQQQEREIERKKIIQPIVDDIQRRLEADALGATMPEGMQFGNQYQATINQNTILQRMNQADSPERLWGELESYFGTKKSDIDDEELRKQGKSTVLAHWDENKTDGFEQFLVDHEAEIAQGAARLGMSVEDFTWQELIPKMSEDIASRFNQNMSEKYSVKDTGDYLAKRMINSSIGALARMSTGMTAKQSQLIQEGLQKSNDGEGEHFNASWYDKAIGEIAQFAPDAPLMMIGGAIGGGATKLVGAGLKKLGAESLGALVAQGSPLLAANVGKAIKYGGLLGNRILGSAANMGSFMGISGMLQAMASTDSTEDGYWSSIGLAGLEGLGEGVKIGTALGALGMAGGKLSSLSSTAKGRAAIAGGAFLAENQIFALSDYLADPEKFDWVDSSLDAFYMMAAGRVAGLQTHGLDGMKKGFADILYGEPKVGKVRLTDDEKAIIQRAFGGMDFKEIAGDVNNIGKILADKENIPLNIRQKISGATMGAFEPNRPHTYMTNIRGNEIQERAKNGELLAVHKFADTDERDQILQEIADRKANDEMISYYNILNLRNQAGLTDALDGFCKDYQMTLPKVMDVMGKKPVERTFEEQSMMDDLSKRLHDTAFPEGELHPAQSAVDGANAAASGPVADPNVAAQLTQEVNNATAEYNQFMQANTDVRDGIARLGDARPDEVMMFIANNYSGSQRDEGLRVVSNYFNAIAKRDGYINKVGDNINNYVDQEIENSGFKGMLDGVPEVKNIITVTDGKKDATGQPRKLTLLNGEVGTTIDSVVDPTNGIEMGGTRRVNPETSGSQIICRDENGQFVILKPDTKITILDQMPKEDYANNLREELGVENTSTLVETGLVNPQAEQQAGQTFPAGEQNVSKEGTNDSQGGNNQPIYTRTSSKGKKIELYATPEETDQNGVKHVKIGTSYDGGEIQTGRNGLPISSELVDFGDSGVEPEPEYYLTEIMYLPDGRVKAKTKGDGSSIWLKDDPLKTNEDGSFVYIHEDRVGGSVTTVNGQTIAADGKFADQAPAEPQQAVEIPVDKEGSKRYEQISMDFDMAIDDMRNDVKKDEVVNELIDSYIAEAKDKQEKLKDKKPTKPAEVRKKAIDMMEAEQALAYYKNLKERYKQRLAAEKALKDAENRANEPQNSVPLQPQAASERPKGKTADEKRAERIVQLKQQYGDDFDDDFTYAQTAEELASMYVGRNRTLSREDLAKELGYPLGLGTDEVWAETLLAKKGEGMSTWDVAHAAWQSDENPIIDNDGNRKFTDQEIHDALIAVFQNAKQKSDIMDYAINAREEAARQKAEGRRRQKEEARESGEQPVTLTEEELARIDAEKPFGDPTDDDFPELPKSNQEQLVEEVSKILDPEVPASVVVIDANRTSDKDWYDIASEAYGGIFPSEEDIAKLKEWMQNKEGGFFFVAETGKLYTADHVSIDKIKELYKEIKEAYERAKKEEENPVDTRTGQADERVDDSERQDRGVEGQRQDEGQGEGGTESGREPESSERDEYLKPRNEKEEKIVEQVHQQLQQEIAAAIKERDKAASELQKARAKESDRATDMFSDDKAFEQEGQLFGFDEMPTDRSVEGIERRTETERKRLEEAQKKLDQLQSEAERNSRIRGALDNERRQTSIEDMGTESKSREDLELEKNMLESRADGLEALLKDKPDNESARHEYDYIKNRLEEISVELHKMNVNSPENLEFKKQRLTERAESLESILKEHPNDKQAQEELNGVRERIDEINENLKAPTSNPMEAIEQAATEFKKEQGAQIGVTHNETEQEVTDNENAKKLIDEPLTTDEIDNADVSDQTKTLAKAYLNGNHGILQEAAYLNIHNHVRNRRQNDEADSLDAKRGTQLDSGEDQPESGLGRTGGSDLGMAETESQRTDERPEQPAQPSLENGEGRIHTASGERSDNGVSESEPKLDGLSSGGERPRGRSVHSESRPELGGGQPNRGSGSDTRKAPAGSDAAIAASKQRLAELRAKFKAAKHNGELGISLVGMNNEQIGILMDITTEAANLGYQYLAKGLREFKEWSDQMLDDFHDWLQEDMKWGDTEIDEYLNEVWNCEYNIDGVTRTIREWASFLGEENLRKQIKPVLDDKYEAQKAAESVEAKVGDIDNIRQTLPFLLPEQQDDVLKTETQFFDPSHQDREHGFGKGMMFTNGTGTGKTYTGLGIVKRFVKQGKGRVLILTPSQEKVTDWKNDGLNLGLNIEDLDSAAKAKGTSATKAKGNGVVVTTYANARQNLALLEDCFDLIVYDESHKITEGKEAAEGEMYKFHQMLTNKDVEKSIDRQTYWLPEWIEHRNLIKEREENRKVLDMLGKMGELNEEQEALQKRLNARMPEIEKRFEELRPIMQEIRESKREQAEIDSKRTKTVFLSATPFNTRENLKYAEGYLFSYPEEDPNTVGSYNHRSPEDAFFERYFPAGYRWRYGRLEQHVENAEALGRQEIDFSDYLQNQLGTLSGRMITSEWDYSRDFPILTLDHAGRFNQAMSDVYRNKKYNAMSEAFRKSFDYNYSTALFEAMKTSLVIERMKEHLNRGRKVVVFHRRRTSGDLEPPFERALQAAELQAQAALDEGDVNGSQKIKNAIKAFREDFADMLEWEKTLDYTLPRDQIAKVFGEDKIGFFSGAENKRTKHTSVEDFMKDNGGKDIIVIQEASGKEGISLHDKTGEHQRVEINLALPQSPIAFIQIEGRIYRIGQKSNAIFEYPLLGLDLETSLFAQRFNSALGTTENLALGSKARNLRQSIANAVLENSGEIDYERQGLGGKDMDGQVESRGTKDGFDNAISDYYGNHKMKKGRGDREGFDYFPTPEPVGWKMVQWAQLMEGESALEPSAGHGAIARYVPESNPLTAIEPSADLFSKLQMRAGGPGRKFEEKSFEDYPIANKHDAIVMNPPYGAQGKMAMDHVAKAFKHLNEGGRLIAIIPDGPSMERRFTTWLQSGGAEGLNGAAVVTGEVKLPDVAFSRAGTSVRTRIVVIDKVTRPKMREGMPDKVTVDLSGVKTVDELFEQLRNVNMPERTIDQAAIAQKRALRTKKALEDNKFVTYVDIGEDGVLVNNRSTYGSVPGVRINFAQIDNPAQRTSLLQQYERLKNARENVNMLDHGKWKDKTFGSGKNAVPATDVIRDYCDTAIKTIANVLKTTEDGLEKELKAYNEEVERKRQEREAEMDRLRDERKRQQEEMLKPIIETALRENADNPSLTPSGIEMNIRIANGNIYMQAEKSKRILEKAGIDWQTGHKIVDKTKNLEKAYREDMPLDLHTLKVLMNLSQYNPNREEALAAKKALEMSGIHSDTGEVKEGFDFSSHDEYWEKELRELLDKVSTMIRPKTKQEQKESGVVEQRKERWQGASQPAKKESYEYKLDKNTRTGEDMHLVVMNDRVDDNTYKELQRKAKALNDGYYNRFKKAWHFKTEADARKFLEQVNTDAVKGVIDAINGGGTRFSEVTDPKELERLNKEKKEIGYRNVVMDEEGGFGSPMADKLGKKGEKSQATTKFKAGNWERSDEHPELADENGKIDLIKPDGLGTVGKVDYNPYIHIRPDKVNKQFKNAWERPNLVYVEVEYPSSELTSGYKAEKAKKSVGRHPWNGEELILSRWDRVTRVVPWEEVADDWVSRYSKRGVEFDIVPPKLLPILVERGIKILPPHKNMGKECNEAYEKFKSGLKTPKTLFSEDRRKREELADMPVENTVIDSTKDKGIPTNREEALKQFPENGGMRLLNRDQNVHMVASRSTVKHSSLHDDKHVYQAFGKIRDIVDRAVKIGELPVAEDETKTTNSVSVYYAPVRVDGTQYSARLLVKELKNRGVVIEDLSLYNVGMHKEMPSNTGLNSPETGLGPYSEGIDGYKVKDLIHNTQEKDKELIGLNKNYKTRFSEGEENNPEMPEHVQKIVKSIEKTAKSLNTPVKIAHSIDEVTNKDALQALREGRPVKGWFDEKTGEIVLYLPNIVDKYSGEKTVAHEVVGHHGLRALLGEEGYRSYLRTLALDLRDDKLSDYMRDNMARHGFDIYTTVDEYLAEAAEKGYGNLPMWQKVRDAMTNALRKAGFEMTPSISDVKYMVWLSKNQLKKGELINDAKREALLYRLGKERYEAKVKNGEYTFDEVAGNEAPTAPYMPEYKTLFSSTPSTKTAKQQYDEALHRMGYAWKEAHIDRMQGAIELMKAMTGAKRIEDIPSVENFVLAENQMSSKEEQQDYLFWRDKMQPLDKAVASILPDMGKNVDDALRNLQLYMIKKSGLERNRVLYVRDKIREYRNDPDMDKNSIDQLEDDWNMLLDQIRDDIRMGNIDLKEYLENMDAFIKAEIDPGYKTNEHDYSGLTDMYGKGYDDADITDEVMSTESMIGDERIKDLWEKTKAVSQFGLDTEYEGGLDSKDKHDKVSRMFEWYVPLRGHDETTAEEVYDYFEEGKKGRWAGPVLMNAKGRESLSDVDIFAQLGAMSSYAIHRSLENQMKQTFARFVRNHYDKDGDDRLVTELKYLWGKKGYDTAGNEIWTEEFPDIPEGAKADDVAQILEQYEQDMQALEAQGLAKKIRQNSSIPFRPAEKAHKAHHIVEAYINGEKKVFVVNGNPRAAQAVNGMTKAERRGNFAYLSTLQHNIAKLATSYNPDFIISNAERDAIFSASAIGIKESPRYFAQWVANYVGRGMGRGAASIPLTKLNLFNRYRNNELDMSNPTDRYFKEFMENGGETGWVESKNIDKWKKLIKDNVNEIRGQITKEDWQALKNGKLSAADMKHKLATGGKKVLDLLPHAVEAMNERAENMARFATYMTSRQMGRTITRSVSDAKEVSVNFNRKGSGYKTRDMYKGGTKLEQMNALVAARTAQYGQDYIMFYNAGVQGLNNASKLFRDHPVKASTLFTGFALGAFVMSWLNQSLIDSEDPKEREGVKNPYAELPEYIRRNNLCLYTGNGGFAIVALPIELRALYGIGDMAAGMTTNPELKSDKPVWQDIMTQLTQVLPIDFMGEHPGNPVINFLPSAGRPIAEIMTNQNWYGRPIEKENYGNDNKPRHTRAYRNTNKAYMDAAKKWNAATNKYSEEDLRKIGVPEENISEADYMEKGLDGWLTDPAIAQHIVESYLAGLGKTAGNIAHITKMAKEGEGVGDILSSEKMPILRKFHYSPTEQNRMARTRNKWFYYKDEMEQTRTDMKTLKDLGAKDPLKKMKGLSKEDSLEAVRAEQMEKALKKYNKLRKSLNKAKNQDSKDSIQMRMNQLMENTVLALDSIR